jgi:hypothetical protein
MKAKEKGQDSADRFAALTQTNKPANPLLSSLYRNKNILQQSLINLQNSSDPIFTIKTGGAAMPRHHIARSTAGVVGGPRAAARIHFALSFPFQPPD